MEIKKNMEKEKKQSILDNFMRQYSLSRTLRFELKPLPPTKNFLNFNQEEKEKIFPKDKERAINYIKLKYYLDLLHREFINESLSLFREKNKAIDFEAVYGDFKKESNKDEAVTENEVEDINKKKDNFAKLRSKIAESFKGNDYLFDKKVINYLEYTFKQEGGKIFLVKNGDKIQLGEKNIACNLDPNGDDVPCILFKNTENKEETIFNNFSGFTGYLSGFFENRKNLYKDEGKAGSVPTRIIDQNLPRFFENIDKLKSIIGKHPDLKLVFGDIEEWKEYFKGKNLDFQNNIKLFASNNYDWEKVFEPNYYNFCFLQNDIELYNYIVKKLNKDIYQYRQKLAAENKEKGTSKKNDKLPLFAVLYKQILGELKKKSDFMEVTRPTIGGILNDFIDHSDEKRLLSEMIMENIFKNEDMDGIYISNKAINTISNRWFVSWDFFGGKILEKENEGKTESKKHKKISDFVPMALLKAVLSTIDGSSNEFFKESYLEEISREGIENKNAWQVFLSIWKKEWRKLINGDEGYERNKEKLSELIINISGNVENEEKQISDEQKQIIKGFADSSLSIYQMTKYFALIKGVKEVRKEDKNGDFYALIDAYLMGGEIIGKNGKSEETEENKIYQYYNALRNFLTQKEWSEEKIKITFDNAYFLSGWSKSYDKYSGLIYRREENGKYLFYLAVIAEKLDGNDINFLMQGAMNSDCEEVVYEFQKMDLKNFPRMFINSTTNRITGESVKSPFFIEFEKTNGNQAKKIWETYQKYRKLSKKEKDEFIINHPDFRSLLIDYFKLCTPQHESLKPYKKLFPIVWKKTEDYKNLNEFYNDSLSACYKLTFKKVNYGNLYYLVNKGKICLFQIHNKDFQLDENFSEGEVGKVEGEENNETKLFKMLFDPQNLENEKGIVLTLNGGAEVFFREPSLKKEEEIRNFPRKIERKKRYTENKIFLHIPYTLNFSKPSGQYFHASELFNENILQNRELSEKVKIIGIDRGENNLAYYSVIDRDGNIFEQGSLNRIYEKNKDGSPIERGEKNIVFDKEKKRYVLKPTGKKVLYTDYLVLLECIEKNRLIERRSWNTIESIKDLKKGYGACVIHELSELVFKYLKQDGVPPVIAFEKLNIGFKQGRQKVEKQTYQNIELGFARKLNYLTHKGEKNENERGGILNAFQFTPEVKNYGTDIEMKSQVGIMFYVDPSYTSTTCPNCGFRKRINKTAFESAKKAKQKFNAHNIKIFFEQNRFRFVYSGKSTGKNNEQIEFTDTVFSDVERIYRKPKNNKKGWESDTFKDMTKEIEGLLEDEKYFLKDKIDYSKEIYIQIEEIENKEFWSRLMWYFNLILQIRNAANKKYSLNEITNKLDEEGFKRDFLNCPYCHFHSDNEETWNIFGNNFSAALKKAIFDRGEELFNGDANGAYNIARKAALMIEKVRKYPELKNEFLKRNNMTAEELNKKFESNNKYEIKKGKRKNKKAVDGISKNPDLIIDNNEWDKFTQGDGKK